jgi:hypothetical protein
MAHHFRKYWLYQVLILSLAGLISLFLWQKLTNNKIFYFPELYCGVSFCGAKDDLLPFFGQHFLATVFGSYLLIMVT